MHGPRTILPLLLLGLALSGCTEKIQADEDADGFTLRYANQSDHTYKIAFDHYNAKSGFVPFPPNSGDRPWKSGEPSPPGTGWRLPTCSHLRAGNPEQSWIRITLREPEGTDIAYSNYIGPVVFVGNWTGFECGHIYQFLLKDEAFSVEFYEVEEYRKTSWFIDKDYYEKRGPDMQRVPP